MSTCPKHPNVELTCPACVGARGGSARSSAQNRARIATGKANRRYPPCPIYKRQHVWKDGVCRCGVKRLGVHG